MCHVCVHAISMAISHLLADCAGPPNRATPAALPLALFKRPRHGRRCLLTRFPPPPAAPMTHSRNRRCSPCLVGTCLAVCWPCPSFAHLSGPSGVYLESTRARELSSSDGSCSSCAGSYSLQVPPATAVPGVSRSRAAILRRARVQQLAEGRIVRPAEHHLRYAGLQPGHLGPQPDHTGFGT